MTVTDYYRSRVYAAENVVARALATGAPVDFHGSWLTLPIERRFGTVESIQAYVDAALAHPPVRAQWPGLRPVTVRKSRGKVRASYQAGVISIPDTRDGWALRETVVIHELAHHVVRCTAGADAAASHGPAFRAAQIALTDVLIGPEAALLLSATYAESGL